MTTVVPFVAAEHAPLLARRFFADAEASPLVGLLAHVPELLEAAMPFVAAVYGPSSLDDRIKELVIVRVSMHNGCRYCLRKHLALARDVLSDAEIEAVLAPTSETLGFNARERAVFAFADALCASPSASAAPLAADFRDDEIVALVCLGSCTIFLNRFCMALGLT